MLVQIVPGLSPPANGVGDYALRVAAELRASHRIESRFLVCSPRWQAGAVARPFAVEVLEKRSPATLAAALEKMTGQGAAVLLQFSPYGYEPNGCPFWLVSGLRSWMRNAANRTLITMFHELYASGTPWSKAFWLSGLQKHVLRSILGCTHVAMTNMRRFARELQQWDGAQRRDIHCLPVPSNVGEPISVPPVARRSRRACVFGISPGAQPMTRAVASLVRSVVRSWAIEEIVLVGQSPVPETFCDTGCRVVALRNPDAEEVSNILQDCMLGLLSYPETALGKSGVYAAYCAHGVPTVLLPTRGSGIPSLDGPDIGRHFVDLAQAAIACSVDMLQDVADNARDWYRHHAVPIHAGAVARFLP